MAERTEQAEEVDRPDKSAKAERAGGSNGAVATPPPAKGHDREARHKLDRLGDFLDRYRLDGALLQQRANFSWVTCGRDNHVANNSSTGVAAILATADSRVCVASSADADRMRDEELAGTGIEVVPLPWHDRKAATIKLIELVGGRRVAADGPAFELKLHDLPDDFKNLRWALTPQEIARYRDGAARTRAAVEQACSELRFGSSEQEAAGLLHYHLRAHGLVPVMTLVAADDRIERFGQPTATDRKIDGRVMLASSAEFAGLICNVTRLVSFSPLSPEAERNRQAVANIDAAVIGATRPGRSLGDVLRRLQRAYEENGLPDHWQRRHQGGPTGYAIREVVATPGSPVIVREDQAFAWNPAAFGFRSEDTILCTGDGVEILTGPSEEWPHVVGRFEGGEFARADVLVR